MRSGQVLRLCMEFEMTFAFSAALGCAVHICETSCGIVWRNQGDARHEDLVLNVLRERRSPDSKVAVIGHVDIMVHLCMPYGLGGKLLAMSQRLVYLQSSKTYL